MNYEGQICRSPMERGSFMLPVAVGCSYNACAFCTLFKHLTYRQLEREQIEQELQRVQQLGGNPKTVFLGDGNAFGLDTGHLLWILERIHHYFPACTTINMDATVTNISLKSDQELQALARQGVHGLYLGIESGLEDVLRFMRKDHTLDQAYHEIPRIQAAGMVYNAHIMTGIAGRGRGLENAEATARFLNRTGPHNVTNFNMFLHWKAPLYREVAAGNYQPSDEQEDLREERRFLECIDVPIVYDALHDVVEVRLKGQLPRDREKLLKKLDQAIAYWQQQPSRIKWYP